MPYIKKVSREYLDFYLVDISRGINSTGDFTYCIFKLMKILSKEKNFAKLSSLIGGLECAKEEFYRRIVAPYEDEKIKENGDVK